MKDSSICVVLALCFVGVLSQGYTATLPGTNGKVSFTPYDGFTDISVVWNFTDLVGSADDDCKSSEGFSYHIHEIWTPGDPSATSCSGTACGEGITGGHYDPTRCGNARDPYSCDPDSLNTCEVGDLSGRHGKLEGISGSFTTQDVMLIASSSIMPSRSVVFHCTTNADASIRLVGGKIVADAGLDNSVVPSTDFPVVTAAYDGLFTVVADPNTGKLNVSLSKGEIPSDYTDCTAFKYHVHAKWTSTSSSTGSGTTECGAAATGGHYDPTYACGSASEHAGDALCTCPEANAYPDSVQPEYAYEFGDLSGKFDPIDMPTDNDTPSEVSGEAVKGLVVSEGMSIVFHCVLDGDDKDGDRAFCAKFAAGSSKASVSWLVLAALAFMTSAF